MTERRVIVMDVQRAVDAMGVVPLAIRDRFSLPFVERRDKRQGRAELVDPLLRTPRRERHRPRGRIDGRQLRQRDGRELKPALQV